MNPGDRDVSTINARLAEAAESGQSVELILVVRGKVRRTRGTDRWRIRAATRHVLTFRAETVVAATPIATPQRRART